jgi:hypothetical protein
MKPKATLSMLFFVFFSNAVFGQIASEALFDLDLVNAYAELFTSKREADIMAEVYFSCNGSDPVVFRCEGNFKRLNVTENHVPVDFYYKPPYFFFYRLPAGSHILKFDYRVQHFGLASSGAIISDEKLELGANSFWYPRNVASDSHSMILDIVSDPNYRIESNGSMTRDVPNNFKRLRTFFIKNPIPEGMTLSGGK